MDQTIAPSHVSKLGLTRRHPTAAHDTRLTEDDVRRVTEGLRTLHPKVNLTEEQIAAAVGSASVKTISPGTVVMREGELSQFILWIRSGQVEIHRHDRGLLCTLGSGFVGHHSYIYDKPRSATVIAAAGLLSYVQLAVPRDGFVCVMHTARARCF
jgi:CRP-like cAMP-binding protein